MACERRPALLIRASSGSRAGCATPLPSHVSQLCHRSFYRIGTMEETVAVASLAALAQPVRLRVFRALVGAGPEGMNPGSISAMLDVPSSSLSFHLKELVYSGLVSQERDGRNLIYRASLERMSELMEYLAAHCCLGAGCEEITSASCKKS
jgi:ArsR family transcriptional regulator, arsenate/arsenite/antimonite-responsive transcriptional repressor